MSDETCFIAKCPACGAVELTARQVWLVICTLPERSAHCTYNFYCPSCAELVSHTISGEALALLETLLAVEVLEIPEEALEAHAGPPLNADDLIDLMLNLDEAAWALA